MEVVIEYVLIDNLVIDFLILFLSAKILRKRICAWRMAVACGIGAGCSLVSPLMDLPFYCMLLFKVVLGFTISWIALPRENTRQVIASFLIFLLMTAVMGGACFGTIYMLNGVASFNLMQNYSTGIPVGAVLLFCSLIAFVVVKLIKLFFQKRRLEEFVYKTTILNGCKNVKINAFLDTGNTLVDPETKSPIMIIDYWVFNRLFDISFDKLITQTATGEIANSKYIDFGTVDKTKGKILVFQIEKVKIQIAGKTKEVAQAFLGLTFTNIKSALQCNALLSPQFLE